MTREGIKIVEFDDNGVGSPVSLPGVGPGTGSGAGPVPDRGERKGMKIVEFDDSRDEGRATVATAENIGPIKIVEFDDDGPSGTPPPRESQKASPRAIKIRDFDAEYENDGQGEAGAGAKIKVMEFDW